MYRIGEFSKMSKTTVKALHYYDQIDLLKPGYVDELTGHRFYTTEQLMMLHKIQSLKQIGLSIDQIKCILAGEQSKAILEKRKEEIIEELKNYQEQLSHIEFILSGKEEEALMNYQAIIKELLECIVYSKQLTVPNYDAYFQVVPAIGAQVMNQYPDLKCATPDYCFIVYLDGEYRAEDIHIEFCEAVTALKEDFKDIKFKKIEQTTAVAVMHKGPYATLSQAYAYTFDWIEKNGYVMSGPPREKAIDGIWNKESDEEWLTELQIPVVKK